MSFSRLTNVSPSTSVAFDFPPGFPGCPLPSHAFSSIKFLYKKNEKNSDFSRLFQWEWLFSTSFSWFYFIFLPRLKYFQIFPKKKSNNSTSLLGVHHGFD